MPGRPRRDIIFERIIKQNPALAITLGKKLPELVTEEKLLFYKSIVKGLLKRISLLKPVEAEALSKSLPRLQERFAAELVLDSPTQASNHVVISLSKMSVPQLNRHLIEPPYFELAHLAHGLLQTMPPKLEEKRRRNWVEKYGLDTSDAAESDGTLVELILAHNYNITASRVHKILASASKLLR